jgi:hypothetical protein
VPGRRKRDAGGVPMGQLTRISINCPRCGTMDQVQKVSGVVVAGAYTNVVVDNTGGTGAWNSSSGYSGNSAYNQTSVVTQNYQTALGQRLSAPAYPQNKGSTELGLLTGGLAVFALLVAAVGFGQVYQMDFSWDAAGYAAVVTLFSILLAGVAGLVGKYWYTTYQRHQAEFAQQRRLWQQAMNKWEQLYYCARDDLVYIPGEPQFAPAGHIMDFVYSP